MFYISADKIFRRTKLFGGQNFRQPVKFSAVLSAEILSDKVYSASGNNFIKDRKTGEAFLEKNQKHAIFNISIKFLPIPLKGSPLKEVKTTDQKWISRAQDYRLG